MRRRTIHSKDYETLLEMLRIARESRGITQSDLAKKLSMTQSAVSKCELGERRLDIVQLRDWCRAMKLPFVDFVAAFDRAL